MSFFTSSQPDHGGHATYHGDLRHHSFLFFISPLHLMGQTWWWAGLIWSRDLILYPVGLLYVAALWPPPRRILITCHSSFADPSNQDATKYLPRMFVMMARSTHLNSTTTEAVEGPKPELTLFDNFCTRPSSKW